MASWLDNRPIFRGFLGLIVVAVAAWGIAQFFGFPGERSTNAFVSSPATGPARPSQPPPLPTHEFSLKAGRSFATADGRFTVHLIQVGKNNATLTVSAKTGDVYRFKNAEIGRRLVVTAPDATYFLDLQRIQHSTVYMSLGKGQ